MLCIPDRKSNNNANDTPNHKANKCTPEDTTLRVLLTPTSTFRRRDLARFETRRVSGLGGALSSVVLVGHFEKSLAKMVVAAVSKETAPIRARDEVGDVYLAGYGKDEMDLFREIKRDVGPRDVGCKC